MYNYKIIAWLFSSVMLLTGLIMFVKYLFKTNRKRAYEIADRISVRDPGLKDTVARYLRRGEDKILTWGEVRVALTALDKWMED